MRKIIICLFTLLTFLTNTWAQQPINLISISPDAQNISDQFPPPPPRMTSFHFRGTKGTTYAAVFGGLQAQPAVLIGVGADISSTSFDDNTKRLTVNFIFDRSVVPAKGKKFPGDVFLISIDPGAPRQFNPQPRDPNSPPPGRSGGIKPKATLASECYGPLNPQPPTDEKPGPPLEAAGSFMSTNLFEWCVIPPNEQEPFFGFKLRAPEGSRGFFKKKLSPGLVTLLSTLSGKTLTADSFAIFNGDVEASKSITATDDGGLLINIDVNFTDTSTVLSDSSTGSEKTSSSDTRITKTITASEQEQLSLAPKNFQVTKNTTPIYGFVDDPAGLSGQTVKFQRKVGGKFVNIGQTTVKSDGSYATNLKSDKLFSSTSTVSAKATVNTSTIIATIISTQVRTSRSVTLQNKTSSLRR